MRKALSIILSISMAVSLMAGLDFSAFAVELTTGSCGDNVTYEYDKSTKTLTLSGSGDTYDYTSSDAPSFRGDSFNNLVVEDGITSIGNYLFYLCSGIQNVYLSKDIKSIGEGAFMCAKFTAVELPGGLITIGDSAFKACKELTEIVIPDNVTTIDANAFYQCYGLKSVTIGNGVTQIGEYAFEYCQKVKSFTLGNSVEIIGESAFQHCCQAESINLPDSLKTISEQAFEGCTALKNLELPKNLKYIGIGAFESCISLTQIVLPYGVKSLRNSVFEKCTGLINVLIPDSVTTIGGNAFRDCEKLKSITIPKSVKTISDAFLSGCNDLEEVKVDEENPYFDSRNNCNAVIKTSTNTIISGCKTTVIPNGVVKIGSFAFFELKGLESIVIPKSVTSIGFNAFTDCSGVRTIVLGSGLTKMFYCDYDKLEAIYVFNKNMEYDDSVISSMPAGSTLYTYPSDEAKTYCEQYGVNYVEINENTCNNGKHYIDEKVTKEPSCTEEGEKIVYCTVCDDYEETKSIEKLEHTSVPDAAVPATFTVPGKAAGSHCSVCGAIIKEQQTTAQLGSPTMTKLKKGKRSFTAKWSKANGVDGYQIQYSLKKNFKGAKTKNTKSTKLTVKKLKSKKTYYVRVRAYKKINGRNYYSAWSTKKVKTK